MDALTSKTFWADTAVRAIRTMAQTAVGVIGTAAAVSDVNWGMVTGSVVLAGITSLLMSLDRIGTVQTALPATVAPLLQATTETDALDNAA